MKGRKRLKVILSGALIVTFLFTSLFTPYNFTNVYADGSKNLASFEREIHRVGMSGISVDKVNRTISVRSNDWDCGGIAFPVEGNMQYTFSCNASNLAASSGRDIIKIVEYGAYPNVYLDPYLVHHGRSDASSFTFTTNTDTKYIAIVMYAADGATGTISNIQLEAGNVATAYEPYCPKLSMADGKNLASFEHELHRNGMYGVIVDKDNRTLSVSLNDWDCGGIAFPVEGNTQYTFSCNASNLAASSGRDIIKIVEYRAYPNVYLDPYLVHHGRSDASSFTFTTNANTKYIAIVMYAADGATGTISNIQLEAGSVATAYEPSNQVTQTLTTVSPQIVTDDFSNGIGLWLNASNFSISNGELQLTNNEYMRLLTTEVSKWTDYSYEADVKIINNAAGLVFRSQNNENYYMLKLSTLNGGTLSLQKKVNGVWTVIKEVPNTLLKDVKYHIKIVVNRSLFEVYIDEIFKTFMYDNTFSNGAVGFSEYDTDTAIFSNVKVTSFVSNLFNEVGQFTSVPLTGTSTVGEKFSTSFPLAAIEVYCNNVDITTGSLTLSLYKWDTDYNTTVSHNPIASKQFSSFNDSSWLRLTFDAQPEGEYYWQLSNPSGNVGVYQMVGSTLHTPLSNGVETNGDFQSRIYSLAQRTVKSDIELATDAWLCFELIQNYQAKIDKGYLLIGEEYPTKEAVDAEILNLKHSIQYLRYTLLNNRLIKSNSNVSAFLAQNVIDGTGIDNMSDMALRATLRASNTIIDNVFGEYVNKAWLDFSNEILDLLPVIGGVKGITEGFLGHTFLTGRQYTWWESSLNIGLGTLSLVGDVGLLAAACKDARLATQLSEIATIAGNSTVKAMAEDIISIKSLLKTNVDQVFTKIKSVYKVGDEIKLTSIEGVEFSLLETELITELKASGMTDDAVRTTIKCMEEGCFSGDTLITTASGLKRIDSIKEGDLVLAKDVNTGTIDYKEVKHVYIKSTYEFIHLKLDNEEIRTTASHLFFTDSGWWKAARNLKPSDKILNSKGELKTLISTSVETLQQPEKIYNLNVDEFHTYFVGTNGLLVHNNCTAEMMGAGRESIAAARLRGFANSDELAKIGEASASAVEQAIAKGITDPVELARIGKVAGEAAESLKYFNPNGLVHIFEGEIKGTKAVGWHYEPSSTTGRIVSIVQPPNTQGVYEAVVEIRGVLKNDTSTFFPKKWSKDEVMSAIYEAYRNANPKLKADGTEFVFKWTGTSRGITIDMFLDADGAIMSAFPKM